MTMRMNQKQKQTLRETSEPKARKNAAAENYDMGCTFNGALRDSPWVATRRLTSFCSAGIRVSTESNPLALQLIAHAQHDTLLLLLLFLLLFLLLVHPFRGERRPVTTSERAHAIRVLDLNCPCVELSSGKLTRRDNLLLSLFFCTLRSLQTIRRAQSQQTRDPRGCFPSIPADGIGLKNRRETKTAESKVT